jgi:hypothetical protein
MTSINSMQYRFIFLLFAVAGSAVMLFSQQAPRTVPVSNFLQRLNEKRNIVRARTQKKISSPFKVPNAAPVFHPILSKNQSRVGLSSPSLPLVDTAYVCGIADTTREIYSYTPEGKRTKKLYQVLRGAEWVNRYRSTIFNLNAGRTSSEIVEHWITDQWEEMFCDTVAFDYEDRFVLYKTYHRDGDEWSIDVSQTATYDANGYCVSQRSEQWTDHHLENGYQSSIVNNAKGYPLSITAIRWNNGKWSNYCRDIYVYDEKGNIISSRGEVGHDDQWENSYRDTIVYNDADNEVIILSIYWTSELWMNGNRLTYTYDSDGRMLTSLTDEWSGDQYVHYSRVTNTYDDRGNILSELQERWLSGQWVNETRETSTFEINGNIISKFQEHWLNGRWTNFYRLGYASSNSNLWSGAVSESWQDSTWVPALGAFDLHDNNGNEFLYNAYRVQLSYTDKVTDVSTRKATVAADFELAQNYPNPFNPSTTIRYGLPSSSRVSLKIFNILGQEIADLVNSEQSSGWHEIEWSPRTASGLYFYRIEAVSVRAPYERFTQSKEMMLIK